MKRVEMIVSEVHERHIVVIDNESKQAISVYEDEYNLYESKEDR